MKTYLFFDNASTTKCCEEAVQLVRRFAEDDFGNPSSSHALGQAAAKAIRDARVFFAKTFNVGTEQVIFTGSGSEADNLAVYGIARPAIESLIKRGATAGPPPRVICSAIEHPAVRKTVQSLSSLGIDAQLAPVDDQGQIVVEKFLELLTPETVLVSIHQVNNIVGSVLPVEDLARTVKAKVPGAIFHTDAVQAFGKVPSPVSPSPVDLVSISAHKIEGPKGAGALLVLNKDLMKTIRPLVWGGDQEGGLRSGTQNAGLISGFHAAADLCLKHRDAFLAHTRGLRERFKAGLESRGLLAAEDTKSTIRWNSPETGVPHIVSLSVPGFPSGPLAKLLEERNCLVSTGSACSSQKMEPDPVLTAMGLPAHLCNAAIRVSFSTCNSAEDVDCLVQALDESVQLMEQLLGCGKKR